MLTRDKIFTNNPIDRTCPFCHTDIETMDHLFLTCSTSKAIWNASGLVFSDISTTNWLKSIINDKIILSKSLIILYHIWKARNHLIFLNSIPDPIRIAFSAAHMFNNFTSLNKTSSSNSPNLSIIKWKKPPADFSKLNFDGAVKIDSTASAGFVLRNCEGMPILASAKSLGKSNVIVAEAVALRAGLQAALLQGIHNILVEGDSKILIDSVNRKSNTPWRIKYIVEDIWSMSVHFSNITFAHIWREANFVADAVVNVDLSHLQAKS